MFIMTIDNLRKFLNESISATRAENGSFASRFILNSLFISAGIITARLCGFITQIILAFYFGTSRTIDIFTLTLSFIIFFQNLLIGAFHAAAIPLYIHSRQEDERESSRFRQVLFSFIAIGGIISSIILLLSVPFIMTWIPSVSMGHGDILYKYLIPLLPFLMITAIAALSRVLLQSDNRYLSATTALMSGSVINLVLFVVLVKSIGIYALIAGMVAGSLIELVLLLNSMKSHGQEVRLKLTGGSAFYKKIGKAYLPIAMGSLVSAQIPLSGQLIAATLGSGKIASLSYGQRISSIVLSLVLTIVSQILMPEFARLTADRNITALVLLSKRILKVALAVTIPLSIILIFTSEDLTRSVFQRGEFTSSDTKMVYFIQIFYFSQIPAYIGGVILSQVLIALRAGYFFLWTGIFNFAAFFLLSLWLIRYLGVAGISCSESVVSWLALIISFAYTPCLIRNKYTA